MENEFNKGLIILDINEKDDCSIFDPFGMCTVLNCLNCDNCAYTFVTGNEKSIKEFTKDSFEDKYLVEFFDMVPSDMLEYLLDETNDYRITRISDGVVLRYSNEDLIERGYEPRKKKEYIYEKEKPKSLVKKFSDKIKQIKAPY